MLEGQEHKGLDATQTLPNPTRIQRFTMRSRWIVFGVICCFYLVLFLRLFPSSFSYDMLTYAYQSNSIALIVEMHCTLWMPLLLGLSFAIAGEKRKWLILTVSIGVLRSLFNVAFNIINYIQFPMLLPNFRYLPWYTTIGFIFILVVSYLLKPFTYALLLISLSRSSAKKQMRDSAIKAAFFVAIANLSSCIISTILSPKQFGFKLLSLLEVVLLVVITASINPPKSKGKVIMESNSSKSKTTAIILSALLGGLGIDRFYLGYLGLGVVKLLTGGGFGIWWLIDLIMACTGSLRPADGSNYREEVNAPQTLAVAAAPIPPAKSSASDIKELYQLLEQGILTQEEYDEKKKHLLARM